MSDLIYRVLLSEGASHLDALNIASRIEEALADAGLEISAKGLKREPRPTTGPYLDQQPKMFVVDDRGFAWAIWDDGAWSVPVGTDGNYATYGMTEYRKLEREGSAP